MARGGGGRQIRRERIRKYIAQETFEESAARASPKLSFMQLASQESFSLSNLFQIPLLLLFFPSQGLQFASSLLGLPTSNILLAKSLLPLSFRFRLSSLLLRFFRILPLQVGKVRRQSLNAIHLPLRRDLRREDQFGQILLLHHPSNREP